MNRPIIFRAKTLKEGEWVQGDLEYSRYNDTTRIHVYDENGFYDGQHYVQCDTVGQYTGVDDKNGKRIFEGDIVRVHCNMGYDKMGVVKFKDGCFGVYNESEWRKFHPLNLTSEEEHDMGARIELEYTFEVLGNIFDSPELLDEKTSK